MREASDRSSFSWEEGRAAQPDLWSSSSPESIVLKATLNCSTDSASCLHHAVPTLRGRVNGRTMQRYQQCTFLPLATNADRMRHRGRHLFVHNYRGEGRRTALARSLMSVMEYMPLDSQDKCRPHLTSREASDRPFCSWRWGRTAAFRSGRSRASPDCRTAEASSGI